MVSPTHEISEKFDSGATLRVVKLDTGNYGLHCISAEQSDTRVTFSPEAALFIARGLTALMAGGGEKVEKEWQVVLPSELNKIERKDQS